MGGQKWLTLKPESWVIRNAANSRDDENEWDRRFRARQLSDAGIEVYLERGLAASTGPAMTSFYTWHIRSEWLAGRVGEALLRKSMRAAMDMELVVGQNATPGECVRFLLRPSDVDLSTDSRHDEKLPPYEIEISNVRINLDGQAVSPAWIHFDPFALPMPAVGLRGFGTRIDLSKMPGIMPGEVLRLDVAFGIRITVRKDGASVSEARDVSLSGITKIVAAEQMHCTPLTHLVTDEADPNSTRVEAVHADPNELAVYLLRQKSRIEVKVATNRSGSFVGELLMRSGGKTVVLASIAEAQDIFTSNAISAMPPEDAVFEFRPKNDLGVRLFSPLQTIQEAFEIPATNVYRYE